MQQVTLLNTIKQLKKEKEDSSFKNAETQAADKEEAIQNTIKRPTVSVNIYTEIPTSSHLAIKDQDKEKKVHFEPISVHKTILKKR